MDSQKFNQWEKLFKKLYKLKGYMPNEEAKSSVQNAINLLHIKWQEEHLKSLKN